MGIGTTYTIPGATAPNGPNLFDGTEGGGGKTRPEIYAMGLRNPSRLSIDPETDVPYTAWVGPDAGRPDATLGPSTYENAAQVDRAGNYGWPFCMGNGQAYRDRVADGTPRTTNGQGFVPGGPASGGTDGWYDCDNLVNDSTRNTGLTVLPHQTGTGMDAGTMRRANLWYSRGNPDEDGNPNTNTEQRLPGLPARARRGRRAELRLGAAAAVPVRDGERRDHHGRAGLSLRRRTRRTTRGAGPPTGTAAGSCTTTAARA